ncbi:ATP-binding protein [Candidatus Thorarchaeota archaeon]|nr:MAG: ATP-binding protein [Candidatus Thorarchaeota archaeon]
MGTDTTYSELIDIKRPEELPTQRYSQHSVVKQAELMRGILENYSMVKDQFETMGLLFGGRILLIGPPGTDFDAYTYQLAKEIPLKLATVSLIGLSTKVEEASQSVRAVFEFARRNAPVVLHIKQLESTVKQDDELVSILHSELEETTWDTNETLVVTSLTNPQEITPELALVFDRTILLEEPNAEDRTRFFEHFFKDREDIDLGMISDMTQGWSFADLKHLAAGLLLNPPSEGSQIASERIEEILAAMGIQPVGTASDLQRLSRRIDARPQQDLDAASALYPDDFLDQLYLLAVGEDYHKTQRVIESLNSNLPLSTEDMEILNKYPFLLQGDSEERLTRLLRAKKTHDRLARIMGR